MSATTADSHRDRDRNGGIQQNIQQGGEALPNVLRKGGFGRGGRFALGGLFAHLTSVKVP